MLTGGTTGVIDSIAVDLPGFGATPPPDEVWGSADYARALRPVLDEMGESPVVVGHSFGGRVALQLATLYPDRISALVLTGVPLAPAGDTPKSAWSYRAIRRLARARLLPESRLEAARRRHGSDDYRAADGVMRDVLVKILAERYEKTITSLELPVTLVWGEDDSTTPLAAARRAERWFGDVDFVEIPGGRHLVPTESPAVLRHAVLRRLE
jgi:pimeloyl-ACP methyl ester carboxylesterase